MVEYLTGANGRLGRAVLKETNATPLVRRKTGLKHEKVVDYDTLNLEDATVVYHIAGSLKDPKVNVELTKKVLAAIPKSCKIVYASSISVYGKKLAEKPADEQAETNPDSEYAKSKLEAERLIVKRGNYCILRIGPMYDEENKEFHNYLKLIEKFPFVIGSGENRIPFTYKNDVAKVMKKAAKKEGIYNITGDPLTQNQIIELVKEKFNIRKKTAHIPYLIALIGAYLKGMSKEHIDIMYHDRIFNCEKAKTELGFSPLPLKMGINRVVKKYKHLQTTP